MFLTETFAYLALVANITFTGDCVKCGLLTDPLLSSLEALRESGSYGQMMGCAHGLFELIPAICNFAQKRLKESDHGIPSEESKAEFLHLDTRIREWTVPKDIPDTGGWFEQLSTAANIYRYALLIFLQTAMHCSPIADTNIISNVQPIVDEAFTLGWQLLAHPDQSPLWNTLLWPYIIVGSCTYGTEQRQQILRVLTGHPFKLAITDQAARLLSLLWEERTDQGQSLIGPLGLQIVMDKYDFNLCVA